MKRWPPDRWGPTIACLATAPLVILGVIDHSWQMLVIGLAVGFGLGRIYETGHLDRQAKAQAVHGLRSFLDWADRMYVEHPDMEPEHRAELDDKVRQARSMLLQVDPPPVQRRWLRR